MLAVNTSEHCKLQAVLLTYPITYYTLYGIFFPFFEEKNYFPALEGIEGTELVLSKLARADGGAYLCIAQNGVPSPVSKRIMVHVHCEYSCL